MHDFVEDLAAQDRSQRLKVVKMRETIKEGQKTARAKAKYDVKSNLEMARLQHQEREANRQREHELMMLDRQFQLEALRRGPPVPPAPTMFAAGAPAYGAPPPASVIDPSLLM
jgi:hypothetical protein